MNLVKNPFLLPVASLIALSVCCKKGCPPPDALVETEYNCFSISKDVFVYNTGDKSWQTLQMSIERWGIAMAAVGKKIFIAGGVDQNFRRVKGADVLIVN